MSHYPLNPEPAPAGRLPAGPSALSASILLLVVISLTITFQLLAHRLDQMITLAVMQWIFVLIPALCYWSFYRRRFDWKIYARLNPLQPKFLPTILLLSVSTWFAAFFGESMILNGLMQYGFEPVIELPYPETLAAVAVYILVIAVSAGVCEEVLFRGAIMPSLEPDGAWPALLFSAAFFSLTHMSFLNLFSTFFLGIMIGLVVIKTGSLYAGILYHILNNIYAVIAMYCAGLADLEQLTEEQNVVLGLLLIMIAGLAVAGIAAGLLILQKQSRAAPLYRSRRRWFPPGWFNWATILILLIFLVLSVTGLLMGFGVIVWP
jgi:membrane protease YdiL (CAAX protease family)